MHLNVWRWRFMRVNWNSWKEWNQYWRMLLKHCSGTVISDTLEGEGHWSCSGNSKTSSLYPRHFPRNERKLCVWTEAVIAGCLREWEPRICNKYGNKILTAATHYHLLSFKLWALHQRTQYRKCSSWNICRITVIYYGKQRKTGVVMATLKRMAARASNKSLPSLARSWLSLSFR
jgi:hypothetical protein